MQPLAGRNPKFMNPVDRARLDKAAADARRQEKARLEARHEEVKEQQRLFREKLSAFGDRHAARIAADPAFRRLFLSAARSVGVDLLARSKGGGGAALGTGAAAAAAAAGFGSFYFELGVQVVDVGMATRAENGGLIAMRDLLARLRRSREARHCSGGASAAAAAAAAAAELSPEDVRQAVDKLAVLGDEFKVLSLAGAGAGAGAGTGAGAGAGVSAAAATAAAGAAVASRAAAAGGGGGGGGDDSALFVLSVPAALAEGDSCREALKFVLQQHGSGGGGFATIEGLASALRWDVAKSRSALETLLKDGLCWLDTQARGGEPRFYFLALAF